MAIDEAMYLLYSLFGPEGGGFGHISDLVTSVTSRHHFLFELYASLAAG